MIAFLRENAAKSVAVAEEANVCMLKVREQVFARKLLVSLPVNPAHQMGSNAVRLCRAKLWFKAKLRITFLEQLSFYLEFALIKIVELATVPKLHVALAMGVLPVSEVRYVYLHYKAIVRSQASAISKAASIALSMVGMGYIS